MRKALVGIALALFTWEGPAIAAASTMDQEGNAAAMAVGAIIAVEALQKHAEVCFDEAGLLIEGHLLHEKRAAARDLLKGDDGGMSEKHKKLFLEGAEMKVLDFDVVRLHFNKCMAAASGLVAQSF